MREKIKKFLIDVASGRRKSLFSQLLKPFLLLVSFIYILTVKCILFLYKVKVLKKFKINLPVISIGNITVGGTGKTPFLIYLTKRLLEKSKKVAIVSRGYARDELEEVKFYLPPIDIFTGRDRARSIKMASKESRPEYILLDDGFQHWKLNRDLDIVTLDVSAPFENERVLPAGFLREPISHIKRADVILLMRVDLVDRERVDAIKLRLKQVKKDLKIFEVFMEALNFYDVKNKKTISLDSFKGKSVGVFCGLGNNEAFLKMLKGIGLEVAYKKFFIDHYSYKKGDLALISKDLKEKGLSCCVTTFKDISKIDPNRITTELYCLKIGVRFREKKDEDRFFKLIPGYLPSKV